jgi:O-antigen/teichoic acid export membrane protein
MTLSDRIARGVKANLASRLVYVVANGGLMLLLTRYLFDPGSYGLLYFALSVLGVAQLVAGMGIPRAGAKYVTEYLETAPEQVPHVLRKTLLYNGVAIAVVGGGLALVRNPVSEFLNEPSLAPLLLLGVGYVAFSALTVVLRVAFQAFNETEWSAVNQAIESLGRFVFVVAFVALGFEVAGALLGYILGFALATVAGFWTLYHRFYAPLETAERPDPGLSEEILRYSVPLTATRAASVIDDKVDSMMIGALMNPTAVGYYTLAKQISQFTIIPARALGFTISPTLGEQKALDEQDRAARIYERSLENILLLYLPAGTGLIIVADPTVRFIFGPEYSGAVPVLQVFGLYIVVHAVYKITGGGLDYLGLAGIRARAEGIIALSNAGLNLAFIPIFGVVGAAFATLLTTFTYTAVNMYFLHRELGLRIGHLARRIGVIGGISAGMGALVVALLPYVESVITLVGVVLFGGSVWAVLSVVSGLLDVNQVKSFLT